MTMQRESGSTKSDAPKTRKNRSIGQEISAPAADGNQNGKTEEAPSIAAENMARASGADGSRLTKILQTVRRAPIWAWAIVGMVLVVVSLSLLAIVGILGGGETADGDAGNTGKTANPSRAQTPIDGSFVGKLAGTNALVSVVIAPAADDETRRNVQLFVADGRRLSEWLSGSITDNTFAAKSADGDAEAEGNVSDESIKGSVELPNGKTIRYAATRPGGAAGLYDLTVSRAGKLSGASAAGLALKGQVEAQGRGTGVLKLADGTRLKLVLTPASASDVAGLKAGRIRVIILSADEIAGAGTRRPNATDGDSGFFIRSA
jgi:hypothetical protein